MNKNIQAIYTLTPLQEGILYHTIEMPDSDIYFQQFSCVVEGLTEAKSWQQSWQQVAEAHPIMRTLFTWQKQAQPLQIVRERVSLPWIDLDWSEDASDQQALKWASLKQRDRDLNFDLSTAPLMRFTLVKLSAKRYYFLFSFHHIVLDGWSQRLLFDQAVANYNGHVQVKQSSHYNYSEFIDWLARQDKEAAKAFWTNNLAGFEQVTNIVDDASVLGRNDNTNADINSRCTQQLAIDTNIIDKLNAQARRHQLTLNSLVLGAWSLVLAAHNRSSDVLFGTTVAGRPIDLPHADKIAGLFINTLPFRAQIDTQSTLAAWLAKLQSQQAACRQFEQTPLTDIQRYSELSAGTPLFESIIVFENLPSAQASENQDSITIEDTHYTEFSHYPLAILIDPSKGLSLIAVHQESKVSATRAQDVLSQLHTVLLQMSQSLDTPVAHVSTLSQDLKQKQLRQWNQTHHSFPEVLPVHQVFEKCAATTPNKIAIIDITGSEARRLTYAEVNSQANKLAHFLKSQSLHTNSVVPILLERSAQSLVSFLAVMKTGAAYIPLDTDQPLQRNAAIISSLQDDNLLVISQTSLQDKIPSSAENRSLSNILLLDKCLSQIESCSAENLNISVQLEQLAYVIYTSGSTGVPKGVMIGHGALANSTFARNEFYPSSPQTFLLMSSLATDSSIAGIYWTLCSGNTLLLPPKRIEQDMVSLGHKISEYNVTHLLCIPSLYQLVLENADTTDLQGLDTVIVAGESCNQNVIVQHQQCLPSTELYNEYGPSECCVWATASRLTAWEAPQDISIGRPISNTQIYVLDHKLQPVLSEVIGELYIGGYNIAQGYLNEAEKTAEAFIRDPFVDLAHSNKSLYKTGDLVKQTSSGELVFIGRADNQVKLRGFRIEPEEIELVLSTHPLIEEALVFIKTPPASDTALLDALSALDDLAAQILLTEIENFTDQNESEESL